MFPGKKPEYNLYLAGLVFAVVSVLGTALLFFTPLNLSYIIPACSFKTVTGMYCPGCGGTRAVWCFITGHWIKSFLYHPFVPYCGILYIIFMVKGTLAVATKERIRYMKFRNGYIFSGIAIILFQFVIKNALLLIYGTDVLAYV